MAKPTFFEGQTATNPQTQERIVFRGGKWFPMSNEPSGDASAVDAPAAPLTPGADARARITLGLGPAVEAQRQMYRSEKWQPGSGKWGVNPYSQHPIATNLALSAETGKPSMFGYDKQAMARQMGGQEYQDYDQAAKSWEAAILPILSGSAVTPSEAQRQLRANLPQLGDTPKTLAAKAKNRAMMTNAAADLAGKPRPFAKVGTWDWKGSSGATAPPSPAGSPAADPSKMSDDDIMRALGAK